jgi:hypothetical protein
VIVGRKAGEAVMRGAHVFVPGLQAVSQGEQGALSCHSWKLVCQGGGLLCRWWLFGCR